MFYCLSSPRLYPLTLCLPPFPPAAPKKHRRTEAAVPSPPLPSPPPPCPAPRRSPQRLLARRRFESRGDWLRYHLGLAYRRAATFPRRARLALVMTAAERDLRRNVTATGGLGRGGRGERARRRLGGPAATNDGGGGGMQARTLPLAELCTCRTDAPWRPGNRSRSSRNKF